MATTKERIFVIADEMDANGQNPTLALVRKHLGGGSFTTISEAMTEWRARKSIKKGPSFRESPPQPVTDRIGELGTEIRSLIIDLSKERLAPEREVPAVIRIELDALQGRVAAIEMAKQVACNEASTLEKFAGLTERVATAEPGLVETKLARVNKQNAGLNTARIDSMKGKKKSRVSESLYKQGAFDFANDCSE
jgi:hypothetical protein